MGTAAGTATVKASVSTTRVPLLGFHTARTVTCSPAKNGLLGTKLVPLIEAYARKRPAWRPLCEPTTEIGASVPVAAPRKLICVAGRAAVLPRAGEIATDDADA